MLVCPGQWFGPTVCDQQQPYGGQRPELYHQHNTRLMFAERFLGCIFLSDPSTADKEKLRLFRGTITYYCVSDVLTLILKRIAN